MQYFPTSHKKSQISLENTSYHIIQTSTHTPASLHIEDASKLCSKEALYLIRPRTINQGSHALGTYHGQCFYLWEIILVAHDSAVSGSSTWQKVLSVCLKEFSRS